VPVHDLIIHPRECDLVAGTYGRGIWISNVAPLRELNEAVLGEDVHFFAVQPRARRNEGALGGYRLSGDRHAVTPNDLNGLSFVYYLKNETKDKITIAVNRPDGSVIRTIEGSGKAGINTVAWNLGGAGAQFPSDESQLRPAGAPAAVPPGEYEVTLQVGERKLTQTARVRSAKSVEAPAPQDN